MSASYSQPANHIGTLGDENTLDGAYSGIDPRTAALVAAIVRAHDPNPDDLLEALGIGGGSDAA